MLPNLLHGISDDWLLKDWQDIHARWPLALIGSTQLHDQSGELKRARVYPWGLVDIDNPEFSDMLALEKLLISYASSIERKK